MDDFDIFDFLSEEPTGDQGALNPWTTDHVLSTGSFPSTQTVRKEFTVGKACSCSGAEKHRSFFDFCKLKVRPNLERGEEIPTDVKVCWNAVNIFEMQLPRKLISRPGGGRSMIDTMKCVGDVEYTLRKGTYWYSRAAYINGRPSCGLTDLGRQLLILLSGHRSGENLHNRAGLLRSKKFSNVGLGRLKNVLALIDGITMQICLCFPGREAMNWERIDTITHCLLRNLVPDYNRPDSHTDIETSFEKIKRIRKSIKENGFHVSKNVQDVPIPRELSFFRALLKGIADGKTPIDMYRVSVLCQTRASGAPPRTVFTKTFEKIKAVLKTPPDVGLYERVSPYLGHLMDEVHASYCAGKSEAHLGKIFARMEKMAKVSLSDSAEIFHSAESGGKLEAAREVLSSNPEIPEISLESGEKTGVILTPENATFGERLFHWALRFVDLKNPKSTYDSNIMSVKIHLVAEMGKYRGITISHLAHAVILHVFSHVGLAYLKEIPSSASGVGAANHAWNFFKRMSQSNPAGSFIFGNEDTYLFSTDWETATDMMEHRVTAEILNKFCTKLGIPAWYRRVIVMLLCQPRQIEFLSEDQDRILDKFYTGRATLMGDPVTKVVLHLYHLLCRKAAEIATKI